MNQTCIEPLQSPASRGPGSKEESKYGPRKIWTVLSAWEDFDIRFCICLYLQVNFIKGHFLWAHMFESYLHLQATMIFFSNCLHSKFNCPVQESLDWPLARMHRGRLQNVIAIIYAAMSKSAVHASSSCTAFHHGQNLCIRRIVTKKAPDLNEYLHLWPLLS